ncbi:MAG: formimidoylglutamase [Bdellovibrionales bacterium]|nr:formimidoylglutamase [Bdellovibrionales bacterium]
MSQFEPCSTDLFFKSTKEGDKRLGEFVSPRRAPDSCIIAGYPDDEGIKLNGGRLGAALAPDLIRKHFYKMTPSPWASNAKSFFDLGNLKLNSPLEARHEAVKAVSYSHMEKGHRWIGLGGGNDYAYAEGAGFLRAQRNSKHRPLVINFDAHLDVRPTTQGLSSGTPFYRLLSDTELGEFDFVEMGIQAHCNSPTHYEWAKSKGAKILTLEELNFKNNFVQTSLDTLAPLLLSPRPTYLSLDMDSFSSAYAPGCSASYATGFIPHEFLTLFQILNQRLDVRCLGIFEVSPPLDIDERTAKLAAQVLHVFLHS